MGVWGEQGLGRGIESAKAWHGVFLGPLLSPHTVLIGALPLPGRCCLWLPVPGQLQGIINK